MESTLSMPEQDEHDITTMDEIIVRADEVDEAGADIATIATEDDSELSERVETRRAHDAEASGSPRILANAAQSSSPKPPVRPILRREGSAPAPPQQPPPPAPQQQLEDTNNPTDSLSLAQLKRLVTDLPKFEATAYAYIHEDTRSFPEEIDEWFQYTDEDKELLVDAESNFEETWRLYTSDTPAWNKSWGSTTSDVRKDFLIFLLRDYKELDDSTRVSHLESILYITLGAWKEMAGLVENNTDQEAYSNSSSSKERYAESGLQIQWMAIAARSLCQEIPGALQTIYDVVRLRFDREKLDAAAEQNSSRGINLGVPRLSLEPVRELNAALTILYVITEVYRKEDRNGHVEVRQPLIELEPSILQYLSHWIAKLRWDDSSNAPLTRVILLFWKIGLLVFGSSERLRESKQVLCDKSQQEESNAPDGFITASPLDYHLFRQEITSKYPAYNPPPPLVPLEPENNSVLPPLPNHSSRNASQENLYLGTGSGMNAIGKSIYHQPVHIATPAPSPPPSPAGPGGKGGKKQNYQTNQNFPFLYPPLDDGSNVIGGKGPAGLKDHLVGKKWEGSDVPASIMEAGQLFASRMRMSRSMRQLWEVREQYIRFERGWNGTDLKYDQQDHESEDLGIANDDKKQTPNSTKLGSDHESAKETEDQDVQSRLDAVETFYKSSLPHLQSIVIVLLKVLLANVTALAAHMIGQNGAPGNFTFPDNEGSSSAIPKPKANLNLAKQMNGLPNGYHPEAKEAVDINLEELNAVRLREITSKAIAGTLLMLLKWFKLSHVVKFEYLTQLLLDSNYLPLALKLFAHQDVDRAVEQKNDRADLDFFYFCRLQSAHPPKTQTSPAKRPTSTSSSSSSCSDDAAPPPIPRHRRSPTASNSSPIARPVSPSASPPPMHLQPQVDELGYPITKHPPSPLTNYAPRFFHTHITHLRLLQKLTKRKTHRCLLLVQYKSSAILRKALKIPQPEVRLYTLKLFKSQVPFCGRKWRQSNMRVITAVYLHVKPELRDEWLAGGDVDGGVEEAVPLEQAGRGLVHWWHLRRYREYMEEGAHPSDLRKGDDGAADGGKTKEIGEEEDNEEGELEEGESRDEPSTETVADEDENENDDFFARELEKMGWGSVGPGSGSGIDEFADDDEGNEDLLGEEGGRMFEQSQGQGQSQGASTTTDWDGGPLQMEGW